MKAILFLTLCITTVQSLVAQDTVLLKNGKVADGKIISLSYGPEADMNSNGSSSAVTGEKAKNNPCNCITKQNESADKIKTKPAKSRNSMY